MYTVPRSLTALRKKFFRSDYAVLKSVDDIFDVKTIMGRMDVYRFYNVVVAGSNIFTFRSISSSSDMLRYNDMYLELVHFKLQKIFFKLRVSNARQINKQR